MKLTRVLINDGVRAALQFAPEEKLHITNVYQNGEPTTIEVEAGDVLTAIVKQTEELKEGNKILGYQLLFALSVIERLIMITKESAPHWGMFYNTLVNHVTERSGGMNTKATPLSMEAVQLFKEYNNSDLIVVKDVLDHYCDTDKTLSQAPLRDIAQALWGHAKRRALEVEKCPKK